MSCDLLRKLTYDNRKKILRHLKSCS